MKKGIWFLAGALAGLIVVLVGTRSVLGTKLWSVKRFLLGQTIMKGMTGPGSQSPVRVLGGSTTFESIYGWMPLAGCTPSQPDTCSYVAGAHQPQSFQAKTIYLDGLANPVDVTAYAWQITTQSYLPNGKKPGSIGATLCSSPTATSTTCGQGSYVLLIPNKNTTAPNTPGSFFSKDSPPDYDNAVDQSIKSGKRYHNLDSNCNVATGDFCDHLVMVTVTINGQVNGPYRCPLGRCVVGVQN